MPEGQHTQQIDGKLGPPPEDNTPKITIEIHPDTINTSTVHEINQMLTPEILETNRNRAHGINVLGEGPGYDYLTEPQIAEALANPHQTLVTYHTELDLSEDEIRAFSEEEAIQRIGEEVEKINAERLLRRKRETQLLEELGVDGSIKIHMCTGPFDHRRLDIEDTDPIQEQAFTYIKEQLEEGLRVQIALGPGIQEYTNEKDQAVTNTTSYVDPETDTIGTGETWFHLPTQSGELKDWEKYCKYVAGKCTGAEFDIWVEPNHNLDDNGHGQFKHNDDANRYGEFSSQGRNPEDYATAVISASNAIKEDYPRAKIGINVAFVDTEYIVRTLEAIQTKGYDPTKVVDYVSFNPYRQGKPPEQRGPQWNKTLTSYRGDQGPKGRFNWDTEGSYEDEIISMMKKVSALGIRDLRISESGWPKESLTRQQQAKYNLRGWILNRYLGLPECPWTLSSESEQFAFIDQGGKKTKSFWAYRNFNRIFSRSVCPQGEIDIGNDGIVCKVFEDKDTGDQIYVIWSSTDYYSKKHAESTAVTLTFPKETEIQVTTHLTEENPTTEKYTSREASLVINGEPQILRLKSNKVGEEHEKVISENELLFSRYPGLSILKTSPDVEDLSVEQAENGRITISFRSKDGPQFDYVLGPTKTDDYHTIEETWDFSRSLTIESLVLTQNNVPFDILQSLTQDIEKDNGIAVIIDTESPHLCNIPPQILRNSNQERTYYLRNYYIYNAHNPALTNIAYLPIPISIFGIAVLAHECGHINTNRKRIQETLAEIDEYTRIMDFLGIREGRTRMYEFLKEKSKKRNERGATAFALNWWRKVKQKFPDQSDQRFKEALYLSLASREESREFPDQKETDMLPGRLDTIDLFRWIIEEIKKSLPSL